MCRVSHPYEPAEPTGPDLPLPHHEKAAGPSPTVRVVAALGGAWGWLGLVVSGLLSWQVGLLLGWMAAATLFIAWMWATIWPLSAHETAVHAVREDTGRATSDALVVVAAVASLAADAVLLAAGSAGPRKDLVAALGVASVAWRGRRCTPCSRPVRHAPYYSRRRTAASTSTSTDPPRYADFAYLAFTIGMTFQVSDTVPAHDEIRRTALRHALLSYVFGGVVIAATINMVAGWASNRGGPLPDGPGPARARLHARQVRRPVGRLTCLDTASGASKYPGVRSGSPRPTPAHTALG